MKKCITTGAILLVLAFTLAAASFAWFSVDKIINFPDSYGAIDSAAYFAGGDGTQDNPYIINSPVHLYNLAWLQYLGYFNMKEGFNNGVAQNYFTLAGNIDMSGMCLPPIGTEEYPFVGIFNGNGKIISKINVSNKRDANNITQHPTNAVFENNILQTTADTSSDKQDIQIVGLFGVVGDYNKYVSGETEGYSVGKNKDEEDLDKKFDTAAMSVNGFYIDNLHVKTHSNNTLVGLIAGYVGANVKNTGVYRCDITAGNSSALGLDGNACISKYSIVGDYDANIVQWKELQNVAGTPGQEAAWGGSINMSALWDRLTALDGKATYTWNDDIEEKTYKCYYNTNDYREGVVSTRVTTNYIYMRDESNSENPTYIPLNVLNDCSGDSEKDPNKKDDNNKYYVHTTKNTGYIGVGDSGDYVRLIKKSWNYDFSSKKNVYTIDSDGIKEVNNSKKNEILFENYKNAYDQLRTLYTDNSSSLYGLRFRYDKVSDKNKYTAEKVYILGTTYEQYEMTRSSIDFQLKESGKIAFFACTNFNASPQSFFSLHEIVRDKNDKTKISTVNEIKKIYKTNSGNNYIYVYAENETLKSEEGYTLVFNTQWITDTYDGSGKKMFYFEIPVNAGEYALGSVNGADGASLVYLDIGANGSGDDGTTEVPSDAPYTISYLDFVSPAVNNTLAFPTEKDEKGEYIPAYDDVIFALSNVANAEAIVWFKRESWTEGANPVSTVVLYSFTNITVAPTPTDKASESDKAKTQS